MKGMVGTGLLIIGLLFLLGLFWLGREEKNRYHVIPDEPIIKVTEEQAREAYEKHLEEQRKEKEDFYKSRIEHAIECAEKGAREKNPRLYQLITDYMKERPGQYFTKMQLRQAVKITTEKDDRDFEDILSAITNEYYNGGFEKLKDGKTYYYYVKPDQKN